MVDHLTQEHQEVILMARRTTTPKPAASEAPAPAAEPEKDERITITGRLCIDPVLRHTGKGLAITNLRLAVQGTDPTQFVTAIAFRRTAEVCVQYLRRGRLVEVKGTPRTREWTDQEGQTRQTDEIVASSVEFLRSAQASSPAASEQEVA